MWRIKAIFQLGCTCIHLKIALIYYVDMSYKHNYLKNLFLSDSYANALYQLVLERGVVDVPKFQCKTLRRLWKNRESELDHDINDIYTTIESNEWDLRIDADRSVCVYIGESLDFEDKYEEVHAEQGVTFCTEDGYVIMTHDQGSEELVLFVDVCPTLGEEYPHILRDMERKIPKDYPDDSYRYVLLVNECTVESCEWEDLVEIFDEHDITLCSFKEMMQ